MVFQIRELFQNCIKITRNTLELTLDKTFFEYNNNKSSKENRIYV